MQTLKNLEQEYIKVEIEDRRYETLATKKFKQRKPYVAPDPTKVLCIIPGIIQKVSAEKGRLVKRGDRLFVLEAMKMQNDIVAHRDGRVREVHVNVGDMATKGKLLLELE